MLCRAVPCCAVLVTDAFHHAYLFAPSFTAVDNLRTHLSHVQMQLMAAMHCTYNLCDNSTHGNIW